MHVLHLGAGVFAIPLVERLRAALGVRHHERQIAGVDDREAARLVAGADVGDVGDAVARHVVVVEGLAELLRGKHGERRRCRWWPSGSSRPSPPAPSAADATAAPNATASARTGLSCAAAARWPSRAPQRIRQRASRMLDLQPDACASSSSSMLLAGAIAPCLSMLVGHVVQFSPDLAKLVKGIGRI